MILGNPFSVKTPDQLTANDVANLFVDIYTDFNRLSKNEHTFVHGARGTGKSMMLRYLEPSVQIVVKKIKSIKQLENFAVHVPIKHGSINVPELEKLEGGAYWAMAENTFVLYVCSRVLKAIQEIVRHEILAEVPIETELLDYFRFFNRLIKRAGGTLDSNDVDASKDSILQFMIDGLDDLMAVSKKYLTDRNFEEKVLYKGALCDYMSFLLPFCERTIDLSFVPKGALFIMLDDADNLSPKMQKILNSWVSYRTTGKLCLKITTQLKYKTYRTVSGYLIETPHDYNEMDLGTIYTTKNHGDDYYKKIKEIVEKRMSFFGINASAENFFPENIIQSRKLDEIKEFIRSDPSKDTKRKSDDVLRYTVPNYMVELSKKNSQYYSYAGFRHMVDISSGVIRWFLEPASQMYDDMLSKGIDEKTVEFISDEVQNHVIKEWSRMEMFNLAKTEQTEVFESFNENEHVSIGNRQKSRMLRNLVESMGNGFRYRILDVKASERKLMSIMLSSDPSDDLKEVLNLGVEWGYLQYSTIGSKEGIGRNPQYILSRRLAPYFKLDPLGHCGYLSITGDDLKLACTSPKDFINKRFKSGDDNQTDLFDLPSFPELP